jgi:thiamine-phosphate pyrophosphorylase
MQLFKLPLPALMLVTGTGGENLLVEKIVAAVEGGVNVVQVREKHLGAPALTRLASRIVSEVRGRALVLVNGDIAAALASGADGLHLPEDALMPERPSRPFLTGRSVHSREAAQAAWEQCVDYLVAGPVYDTVSHPDRPAAGLSLISEVAGSVGVPVLAIGGIDATNAEAAISAGASGVAVISAILGATSPRDATQAIRYALEAAWQARAVTVRTA